MLWDDAASFALPFRHAVFAQKHIRVQEEIPPHRRTRMADWGLRVPLAAIFSEQQILASPHHRSRGKHVFDKKRKDPSRLILI